MIRRPTSLPIARAALLAAASIGLSRVRPFAGAEEPADWDVNAYANTLIAFVIGRWHQFAKSGFKRAPMEGWPQQWRVFAA